MTPGVLDLVGEIAPYRGGPYRLPFRLKLADPVTGEPILDGNGDPTYADLTGCTGRAHIRLRENHPDLVVAFTVTVLPQGVPATRGAVELVLTGAQTATLPDSAVWDVELFHPGQADPVTYLAGRVVPRGQVTF